MESNKNIVKEDKEWYIGRDLAGYPFNKKYQPDYQKNGRQYSGYATPYQETFFYDYVVLKYDVRFRYQGVDYYIVNWGDCDCYARMDETLKITYESFNDPIELIEQLEINGRKLIDFMDEIEEIEVF